MGPIPLCGSNHTTIAVAALQSLTWSFPTCCHASAAHWKCRLYIFNIALLCSSKVYPTPHGLLNEIPCRFSCHLRLRSMVFAVPPMPSPQAFESLHNETLQHIASGYFR